jgi:hypothetical protein
MARSKKPKPDLPPRWFPPAAGYYTAEPGPGGMVDPPGPPPDCYPTTPEGARRVLAERARRAAERARLDAERTR